MNRIRPRTQKKRRMTASAAFDRAANNAALCRDQIRIGR
jgi:hypothetical protein